MVNLSARGAGLFAREAQRDGERVTVTFPLSEAQDLLTATGVVRWSNSHRRGTRRYPAGLEWLPLEDSTRRRLETFVRQRISLSSLGAGQRAARPSSPASLFFREGWPRVGVMLGLVPMVLCVVWAFSLQWENHQLSTTIQQRNTAIQRLAQREGVLTRELGATQTRLSQTTEEIAQLDQQSHHLEGTLAALSQDVTRIQHSFVQTSAERDALIQRTLELEQDRLHSEQERAHLEQERAQLAAQLSSIPGLRLAIHDAMKVHREAQWAQRRLELAARRQIDHQIGPSDNRGYVVLEGHPMMISSPVWIRVHEPDTFSPQRDAETPTASSDSPPQ